MKSPQRSFLAERGLAVYCPTVAFAKGTPKTNFGLFLDTPARLFLPYNCIKFYKNINTLTPEKNVICQIKGMHLNSYY
jgi:hypothetical protein